MSRAVMHVNTRRFSSIESLFDLNDTFHVIAGPCSVESMSQMEAIAQSLANMGVGFIRGGAFKPRTSPYDFQGLGIEGLKILSRIKAKYGLITVSEIMDPRDVEPAAESIDIIQIGSRNMYNYPLLKEVGKAGIPVLLKRGMMATLDEFILAAEYIISEGNHKVVLCERGIRTFENKTRNTLDVAGIAILKLETNLPVIADLSHALGRTDIVEPVAHAVKHAGADGIMLEVHNQPSQALSDHFQQLDLGQFQSLMNSFR